MAVTHNFIDIDVILNQQETAPPVVIAKLNLLLKKTYRRATNHAKWNGAGKEQKKNSNCRNIAHVAVDVNFHQVEVFP